MTIYESIAEAQAKGGDHGDDASWNEAYFIDWQAQSHSFLGGSSITVDGVEWLVGDQDSATTLEAGVNGLEIEPKTSINSGWEGYAPKNAPRVMASIQDLTYVSGALLPSATYTQAICIQAIITSATDVTANNDGYGLVLQNGATTTHVTNVRQYDSSAWPGAPNVGYRMGNVATPGLTPETYITSAMTAAQHTFFEITYLPGGTVIATSSTDTDFVDPLSATEFQGFVATQNTATSTASSITFNKDDMYVAFMAYNMGSSTVFTPTCRQLRVLTLGV